MKIVDLSVTLRKDCISIVPGHPDFCLSDFHVHERDFRSNSFLQISTHTGTHIDAPFHFIPDGMTIEELPLEQVVGRGVLVDLRKHSFPRKAFTADEIRQAVGEKSIKDKIVILHSGWLREKWGTPDMYTQNPYLSQSAADWLVHEKIKSIGVDFSIDDPEQVALPLEERFPIHRTFLGNGIPHIENLCNLEKIDRDEFLFIALPLKLFRCNGAPARAIAILSD